MRLKAIICASAAAAVYAQLPYQNSIRPAVNQEEISVNRGSAALWQSLKKLHTRASILWFASHPDDEDGTVLAYESRNTGARVVLNQTNRGEGGANVMSDDYFDALGLVRTMELLKADEYYGVEQRWSMVVDYGFSKTLDESMKNWTHDRYFYDVVRMVRTERPLVVITSHPDGTAAGHGNHQATGRVAVEVMKAAADPNVFPDQIQAGLRPWTPLKGYVRGGGGGRGGRGGRGAQAQPANVEVPVGEYDPILGASYSQIAREGLGFQKTQNGGPSVPLAGESNASYRRFASVIPAADKEKTFFDGIDTSLVGLATLAKGGDSAFLTAGLNQINADVEDAIAKFSATKPEAVAPALAAGMKETIGLLDAVGKSNLSADSKLDLRHELEIKRAQFNNALTEALGLNVSASVTAAAPDGQAAAMEAFMGAADASRTVVPGQTFAVRVHAVNQSSTPVRIDKISVVTEGQDTAWDITPSGTIPSGELAGDIPVEMRFQVKVPDKATFTRPYFSRPNIQQAWYDILDPRYRNQSFAQSHVHAPLLQPPQHPASMVRHSRPALSQPIVRALSAGGVARCEHRRGAGSRWTICADHRTSHRHGHGIPAARSCAGHRRRHRAARQRGSVRRQVLFGNRAGPQQCERTGERIRQAGNPEWLEIQPRVTSILSGCR
jgi:LmbE family N-acetylglucosaminyl deacetylase